MAPSCPESAGTVIGASIGGAVGGTLLGSLVMLLYMMRRQSKEVQQMRNRVNVQHQSESGPHATLDSTRSEGRNKSRLGPQEIDGRQLY
jgi:hypothetical protein